MRGAGLAAIGVTALAFAASGGQTSAAHAGDQAGAAPVRLSVDAGAPTGERVNGRLGGVNWDGDQEPAIAPLRPDLARLDAGMEQLFPRGPELNRAALDRLNASLDRVFRAGAEPLLILSYMPPWLADARPGDPRDRTKLPPRDRRQWGALVHRVVTELTAGRMSAGRRPVRRFEVWNEPDWPIFYQDRLDRFLDDIFAPSAEAVAAVERESGLDLLFGGCGCVAPDPPWIVAMVDYARARELPLDFVSWHWYGNHPFLGPDGREPLGTPEQQALLDAIFPLWGRRNPLATPISYGEQVGQVREWVRGALAGSDRRMPELLIDEWNLSAGGFDRRMDTHEGAAYDGGVLAEMQGAGLDRSVVFRAVDPAYFSDPSLQGGWGLTRLDGRRKPAWWTFWLWRRLAPLLLSARLDSPRSEGIWAVASRSRGRLTVLVSSFLAAGAHAHELALGVSGLAKGRWRVAVRRIDADHASASGVERRAVQVRGRLDLALPLPAQSLLFVELER